MVNVLGDRVRDGKKSCDYMLIDYDVIREPLNLREGGRAWFESVYLNSIGAADKHAALLLGSVDWMIDMLAEHQSKVFVIDGSAAIIKKARQEMNAGADKVNFLSADWTGLPDLPARVNAVLGDNSFNFLEFPAAWERVCGRLAEMMEAGGVVLFRFFSVPASHRALSPREIVEKHRASETVNYTAARTDILFSQWDPVTYRIDTEKALACYEANRSIFSALLEGKGPDFRNDLQSIAKYRDTGVVYHVPPLAEILKLMEKTFHITQVNFGPYDLSQYFPLVVASKSR